MSCHGVRSERRARRGRGEHGKLLRQGRLTGWLVPVLCLGMLTPVAARGSEFRPVNGATPWSDRVGQWELGDMPPAFRHLPPVPMQSSAARGLRLPRGTRHVLAAVDAEDYERMRGAVEGLRDHETDITIRRPGATSGLRYRVIGVPVSGTEIDWSPWCRRGVVLLQIHPSPAPESFPYVRPRQRSEKEKRSMHIYLLVGQSNMAGRGPLEPEDLTPHPRVLVFDRHDQWRLARDPLHFDNPRAGAGPGLAFGKTIAEAYPSAVIGLVPCAVGGTRIGAWQREGRLFEEAVRRTRLALEEGELKGILWHQGEGDSYREDTAKAYAENLLRLVRDLRAALDAPEAPFIVGELGPFMRSPRENLEAILAAQVRLVETEAFCGRVSSHGLDHMGDRLHFSAPAARELGRRYAEQWLLLSEP